MRITGERAKTTKCCFCEAKSPKQGVSEARLCSRARDDYATGQGAVPLCVEANGLNDRLGEAKSLKQGVSEARLCSCARDDYATGQVSNPMLRKEHWRVDAPRINSNGIAYHQRGALYIIRPKTSISRFRASISSSRSKVDARLCRDDIQLRRS